MQEVITAEGYGAETLKKTFGIVSVLIHPQLKAKQLGIKKMYRGYALMPLSHRNTPPLMGVAKHPASWLPLAGQTAKQINDDSKRLSA